MVLKAAKIVFAMGILILFVFRQNPLQAQNTAALSGTITDSSGGSVPGAQIFIKNVRTGESIETQANSAGLYRVSTLAPGDYAVSVSAERFEAKVATVTLTGAGQQTINFVLNLSSVSPESLATKPKAAPPAPLQNAPSVNRNAPSLQDLGFSASQIQGNAQEQARLNQRTHMLKVHQTLGLITLAPMVGTLIASSGAKTKRGDTPGTYIEPSGANLDLHVALGALTGAMYAATAYYAIAAPKISGVKPRGAIRLHRDLVWIHGPGMVLTGVLGIMAYNQEMNGQKVHGLASAHGAVAEVTVAAYAASIVSVSWPIHLKFWER